MLEKNIQKIHDSDKDYTLIFNREKIKKMVTTLNGGGRETSIFDQKQKFLNIYLQGTSSLQELTRMLKHAENICPPPTNILLV